MVFCSKCGAEIKDEHDEFCSRCGTKLRKPIKEDTQIPSSNTKKDWCLKCGKELPYGPGEWPPGFPKICPVCGAKVVDDSTPIRESKYVGTHQERGRTSTFPSLPLLIIVFIFSLFWIFASGLSDASYTLYALLGILALYWVYKEGEEERKYVKYIGYFSILFGIFIIHRAFSLSSLSDMILTYGEDLTRSYIISFDYNTAIAVDGMQGVLIFEGIIVIVFGYLLIKHVSHGSIFKIGKPNLSPTKWVVFKILFTIICLFFLVFGILLLAFIFSDASNTNDSALFYAYALLIIGSGGLFWIYRNR